MNYLLLPSATRKFLSLTTDRVVYNHRRVQAYQKEQNRVARDATDIPRTHVTAHAHVLLRATD